MKCASLFSIYAPSPASVVYQMHSEKISRNGVLAKHSCGDFVRQQQYPNTTQLTISYLLPDIKTYISECILGN